MEKNEQKEIAYYSSLLNAWIITKMERDKVILTIASGGIALLVTLLSTLGISTYLELVLYVLAFISFTLTLFVIIKIFDDNSKYIEDIISSNKVTEPKLERLDKLTMISFIFGVVLSIVIGVLSANNKLNQYSEEQYMSAFKNQNKKTVLNSNKSLNESLNNLGKLNSPSTTRRSLNNLGSLSPANSGDSLNNLGKLNSNQSSSENSSSPENKSSQQSSSSEKKD